MLLLGFPKRPPEGAVVGLKSPPEGFIEPKSPPEELPNNEEPGALFYGFEVTLPNSPVEGLLFWGLVFLSDGFPNIFALIWTILKQFFYY